MKIAHIVTDDDRRGGQVFAVQLSERLAERGHRSTVLALVRGEVGGLDVDVLGRSHLDPRLPLRLRRLMRDADVTVAHGSRTFPACAASGVLSRSRFVYRQISDPEFWASTPLRRGRVRFYYRFPAQVVALSSATARQLSEAFAVPADRVTIIPNGVDERRFRPASPVDRVAARRQLGLPEDAVVVAYVGALVPEKGIADLLAALPGGAFLVAAGDGPARAELEAGSERLGPRVRWLGRLDDPWPVYAAADVVAVPSTGGDTHPAVIIEAALVGTPVVATPVGAIGDLIEDGVSGCLVPVGDPSALGAAIQHLAHDVEHRDRLRTTAAERATARLSMRSVAPAWEDLLLRTAGAAP